MDTLTLTTDTAAQLILAAVLLILLVLASFWFALTMGERALDAELERERGQYEGPQHSAFDGTLIELSAMMDDRERKGRK